jgi:hypothetical protein
MLQLCHKLAWKPHSGLLRVADHEILPDPGRRGRCIAASAKIRSGCRNTSPGSFFASAALTRCDGHPKLGVEAVLLSLQAFGGIETYLRRLISIRSHITCWDCSVVYLNELGPSEKECEC